MSDKDLSPEALQALFLLMAEADEVSNPDLEKRYGYTLTGKPRTRLNELKLVESRKRGRAYAHTLTDRGWARAKTELGRLELTDVSASKVTVAAYLAVMHGLRRHLERTGQSISEVFLPYTADSEPAPTPEPAAVASPMPEETAPAFTPPPAMPWAPEDVEKRIRAAYAELTEGPGRHVPLVRLRTLLADLPREDVDAALTRMNLLPDVFVDPQSNQKTLSPEERAAAVRIGDQDKHQISIEVL
jgi:hypothetical protein